MTPIKLFALLLLLCSTVASASLYRWIDDNGKVYFSDKVPPAMSQKRHTSLNRFGITSEKVSSSVELKRLQKEERQKIEILNEMTEAKKAEVGKAKRDKQLLAIYESRDHVISVFKRRVSLD